MDVERFADIEQEFTSRVRSMIWCSVATVDRKQRPYSRILHPLWDGNTGWILTHRQSHKAKHLERNPFVSLAYIRGDVQRPLYVDCKATWVEAADERKRVWNLAASEPPPLGSTRTRLRVPDESELRSAEARAVADRARDVPCGVVRRGPSSVARQERPLKGDGWRAIALS